MVLDPLTSQIVVTIVDKVALGLLLLGCGYWLNRRLEVFKSDKALSAEVAKRRIEKAGEIDALVHDLEAACFAQALSLASLIHRELQQAGVPGLPATLPPVAYLALDAIAPFTGHNLSEAAAARIGAEITPITAALIEQHRDTLSSIRKASFWIGEDLARGFAKYVSEFVNAFGSLEPTPGSWEAFRSKRESIRALRPPAVLLLRGEQKADR